MTPSARALVRLAALVIVALATVTSAHADTHRTDIVFLEAMPASRAMALYTKVLGVVPGSSIVEGRNGRSVVVKDTPARLARFRSLIAMLDVATRVETRIFARPVQYRTPSEVEPMVRDVVRVPKGIPLIMAADDRSSTLVVLTTADVYREVDLLLRRIDVPERDRRKGVRVTPKPEGFPP